MRILFTGSSGPKVASIVASTLAKTHQVVGIDRSPGRHTEHLIDITTIQDWSPYLRGVDAVVHFAALHAPHRDTHSSEAFTVLNVDTTARLIDSAAKHGVRRFLLASSTSVYGRAMRPTTQAVWVTEALVPQPEDIYDETKLAAEALCERAFSAGLKTCALRFSRSFPEPLPLMALYRLYRGVDARDVAQAFGLALTATLSKFEALNISARTPFQQSDCPALFVNAPDVLRLRAPIFVEAFHARSWPLPSSIDRVYVSDRASQVLGYAPTCGADALLCDSCIGQDSFLRTVP